MKKAPRVLMIGWELPPHNSGGLGVACAHLSRALANAGMQINFTLPYREQHSFDYLNLIDCHHPVWDVPDRPAPSQPPFSPYAQALPSVPSRRRTKRTCLPRPGNDLEQKVQDYAERVLAFARAHQADFDIVHAHDWMSLPAAIKIKEELDKPFVAHIHSTEYDRSLSDDRSTYIASCELHGMRLADRVIAVSYYTRRLLIEKYGISANKIDVVHNGVVNVLKDLNDVASQFAYRRPVVVFMGRLTIQKGADYFLDLAGKVIEKRPDVLFIVSGMGDMYQQLLFTNAGKSLSANVLFSGFVRGGAQKAILARADVFVMPSVSEPFGLVATEAAVLGTPVIASKTSGVVEVMTSSPQFDFWDTQAMANEVLHLLSDPVYKAQVVASQTANLSQATWKKAAAAVERIYRALIRKRSGNKSKKAPRKQAVKK